MLYNVTKRLVDVTISFLAIVLGAPVFVLIAFAIKCDSNGSIFHSRKVIGMGGKEFYFIKFRTMVEDADHLLNKWKETNNSLYEEYKINTKLVIDPRVTKVGKILRKYSLDELPQFVNVLLGDMSIVGPRPVIKEEYSNMVSINPKANIRLDVKPGITGYWQTNGRQLISPPKRIEMDIYYVHNCSFIMDIKIILKTPFTIISQKGAY